MGNPVSWPVGFSLDLGSFAELGIPERCRHCELAEMQVSQTTSLGIYA